MNEEAYEKEVIKLLIEIKRLLEQIVRNTSKPLPDVNPPSLQE